MGGKIQGGNRPAAGPRVGKGGRGQPFAHVGGHVFKPQHVHVQVPIRDVPEQYRRIGQPVWCATDARDHGRADGCRFGYCWGGGTGTGSRHGRQPDRRWFVGSGQCGPHTQSRHYRQFVWRRGIYFRVRRQIPASIRQRRTCRRGGDYRRHSATRQRRRSHAWFRLACIVR